MDKTELLLFAKIAEKTYLDPKKCKFEDLGFEVKKFFNIKGAQAYLLENKSMRVLSFRGTEITQPSDVIADLRASKNRAESRGKVHKGFKGELDKLWPEIQKDLPPNSHLPLFITGHSLGAAMATLATSRLGYAKVKALITFGSPRVGNKEFVRNLTVDHFRVVNNNDAVTKVPLWIMGYRHHGEIVYLNYYGFIRKLTTWQRLKDMIRARKKALSKFQLFKGAYDHLMKHYISKLEIKE